jgi:hypothetical protein
MITNVIQPHIFDFNSMTSSVVETVSHYETKTRLTSEVQEALSAYAGLLKRRIVNEEKLIQKIDALYRQHGFELK